MKARCSYRPDLPTAAAAAEDWGDGSWTVDCSCGVNFDDGEEMVSCDECGVWVHTRCARFVKGEPSFACHKCKAAAATSGGDRSGPTGFPSDNEETEVAQLLAELPMKTGPTSLPPFRKWAEVPLQDRVHVQGVPGGDPSLFKGGISSVFNANLWRCTGYVPKKFGFQYREFPCWEEVKGGDSQPNVSQGADALFALSKEAEAAVALPQGTVRKIFKLGNAAVSTEKKDTHRIRPTGDHSSKKRKDRCGETKNYSAKKKSSWDNKRRGPHSIVDKTISDIHDDKNLHVRESPVLEEKSETKIGDASEKSTSNDQVGEGFGDTREEMDIEKGSMEKLPELSKEPSAIEKSETLKVKIEVFSKAQGADESVEAEDFAEALYAMELLKDETRLKDNENEGAVPRTTAAGSEPASLGSDLDKVAVKSENDVPRYTREALDQPYHENLPPNAKVLQDNEKIDNIKDENGDITAEEGFAFRSAGPSKHTPGTEESTEGILKACSISSDPFTHKSCSSGLSRPARLGSLDGLKDPQVKIKKTAIADSKSQSQDHSSKHPIIYHAKGSASSLQKCSQASKIPSSSKQKSADMKEHVARPAANVDESTSSSSRSKLGPVNTCQKGERSHKQAPDACNSSALGTLQMSDTSANLSDEQLALLLHQQLNSSPRVPRVPRLRQTPGMQTTLPAATSMLSKRSSASAGRDIITAPKKKHREETKKERSRESSGMNEWKGSKSGTSQSTSASKDSDKRLPDMPAHQSPTASSTEGATSSKAPAEASCGPSDGISSKCRTLPGLIDEIFNANPHITYDDLCHNVSLHWSNLRKPNGEKYAYTTPVHAVHDILRNRKEWAHLIDQASKTNSNKKRKSLIAEGGKGMIGSEKEKSKNKSELEEERTEESESNSEDSALGKRTARKRRRLELQGRSVKDARRKKNKHKNIVSDDPSDSSDSSSDNEGKNDGNSSDDASRAQTAGSSSSD